MTTLLIVHDAHIAHWLLHDHIPLFDVTHITCTTSNIMYLILCRICGIQYIGETKNSRNVSMVTDPQLKPKSLTLLWANTSIYLITPFLTWSCRALRRLLTAGNRSVSAEKRCGSSVSTPFTPTVSTYRKGVTNFPLFFLLFSFPTEIIYIYFTFIFTFVLHLFCLLVYLSVLFYTHFLTHCF